MPATYEPIATTTLGSAANSITFSSISSAYTDLRMVITYDATISTSAIYMRFNSDTASNYSKTNINGNGTTASSSAQTSQTYASMGGTDAPMVLYEVDIFSYAGSTYKTYLTNLSMDKNGSGATRREVGLWRSTSAITSILLDGSLGGGQLPAGTTATLYGIKAA